jgi:hypothetical protein
LSQGTPAELHFDIRNNQVIFYDSSSDVEKLAGAMIAAAAAFEEDANKYVNTVVESLSAPAVRCLHWRGEKMVNSPSQALHTGIAPNIFTEHPKGEAVLLFQLAIQELVQRKLLKTILIKENQMFGMFPTKLGEVLIKKLWPHFFR